MKEPNQQELREFLQASPHAEAGMPHPLAIEKDLVGSKLRLSLTYVLGSALGYLLSLSICAQCSVGLTHFAWKTASLLHTMPDPWCPILCGFIFGFSPTVVSFLYLSRFQHRFLLFRMAWLPALVPIVSSVLLLLAGDPHDWAWRTIWTAAAISTPYALELVAALILRQAKWKAG